MKSKPKYRLYLSRTYPIIILYTEPHKPRITLEILEHNFVTNFFSINPNFLSQTEILKIFDKILLKYPDFNNPKKDLPLMNRIILYTKTKYPLSFFKQIKHLELKYKLIHKLLHNN